MPPGARSIGREHARAVVGREDRREQRRGGGRDGADGGIGEIHHLERAEAERAVGIQSDLVEVGVARLTGREAEGLGWRRCPGACRLRSFLFGTGSGGRWSRPGGRRSPRTCWWGAGDRCWFRRGRWW